MINRIGLVTGPNSAALLMQITEQEREVMEWVRGKEVFLSRYYFMQLFEQVPTESRDYCTFMNFYIEDNMEIGESVKGASGNLLFPIRANLRISLDKYDALRAPYRNRGGFPSYQRIG